MQQIYDLLTLLRRQKWFNLGRKIIARRSFRKSKDGYLILRRQYNPYVRKVLVFVSKIVKLIIDKRDDNRRVNEQILEDLEVPINTPISELDAFYKKEFRKRKYMHTFKNRIVRYLPEPKKKHFDFLPDQSKIKMKVSPVEFFKSFGEKNGSDTSSKTE